MSDTVRLGSVGQIALAVADVDRAEAFYAETLGLRRLFRFGDLTFLDCGGLRLLLERAHDPATIAHGGCVYFRCADIALTMRALSDRGVAFTSRPHLIARMDDHDLWMAFFTDPDGHTLALMQEAPRGYVPPPS